MISFNEKFFAFLISRFNQVFLCYFQNFYWNINAHFWIEAQFLQSLYQVWIKDLKESPVTTLHCHCFLSCPSLIDYSKIRWTQIDKFYHVGFGQLHKISLFIYIFEELTNSKSPQCIIYISTHYPVMAFLSPSYL